MPSLEASHVLSQLETRLTFLPIDGIAEVDSDGVHVHTGDDEQVQAHAEVGKRQVTHEELGRGQLEAAVDEYDEHNDVADHRCDDHQPDCHPGEQRSGEVRSAGLNGVRSQILDESDEDHIFT